MVRTIVAMLVALLLQGCYDKFYGPKFRNEYPGSLSVMVYYGDGSTRSATWPQCTTTYVGMEGVEIERVTIEYGGRVVREINKAEVTKISAEKEDGSGRGIIWVLAPTGISKTVSKQCGLQE